MFYNYSNVSFAKAVKWDAVWALISSKNTKNMQLTYFIGNTIEL